MTPDTLKRTLVKALVWGLLGVGTLLFTSVFITKDFSQASIVTGGFYSIRFVMYVVHERVWDKIEWGK